MKPVLFLTFLLFRVVASAQNEENEVLYYFPDSRMYYILEDSVNIRKGPSLNDKVIAQLPIGSPVKIKRRSDVELTLNGIRLNWYEIIFDNGREGFVWGGKIAVQSVRSTKNTDIALHFGVDYATQDESGKTIYFFQVRSELNGKELNKISVQSLEDQFGTNSFFNYGNQGLKNVDDVLFLYGMYDEMSTRPDGIVIFHTNGYMVEVMRLEEAHGYPDVSHDVLLFPADMEGVKDKLVYFHEIVHWDSDSDETWFEEKNRVVYSWNGKNLVESHD